MAKISIEFEEFVDMKKSYLIIKREPEYGVRGDVIDNGDTRVFTGKSAIEKGNCLEHAIESVLEEA